MRAIIYFRGPKTAWSGRIDETEVIASKIVGGLLMGRWWAISLVAQFDRSKIGWAVLDDTGIELAHVPPIEVPA